MIKFAPAKNPAVKLSIILLCAFLMIFQGCIKKRSAMATLLYKKTHNKIFKDASPDSFKVVFERVFKQRKSALSHPALIMDFYEKTQFTPVFVLNHLYNGDLDTLAAYLDRSDEHGLNPGMFQSDELKALIAKFRTKPGIKTLNEAYYDMAELELAAANSLIEYSNALQFGAINPRNIYQRYYLTTREPDSLSMVRVFHIGNMGTYLNSIQPNDPQYLALQRVLKDGLRGPKLSAVETKRLLIVNLERLRWKNKPTANKYVIVNIPDFSLDVIDSGRSALHMKVCVGQGRNMDNANTLAAYNDSCRDDKPNEHETPLLNSQIYGVEVNPVWNIPQSIADKEIIVEAAKDKFYLDNNNIDVYKDGKLVEDPEDIDWTKFTKDNLPYDFKQRPGTDNSLGLIKFLFNNKSSIYLHDTPVKSVFYEKMRAVSHGCVRLGDPKGLALSLFGEGERFKTISDDMEKDNPDPTTIYLPKKVPVYITYITCWADERGNLQFRNDVYGLDIVLWDHLSRLLHQNN
jgi:murein L,D-transpeptidase YcbB/YkuD